MSEALDTVLAPAKEAFCDALFSRVRAHLYSQLLCMGRHTITGLLSTQGRVHQDWSADYRLYANRRLDPEALFGCVRQELRAGRKEREPLVLALDDSLLRKRGPRAQLGRPDVAVEYISRAIALKGQVAEFHNNLAKVYQATGRTWARRC